MTGPIGTAAAALLDRVNWGSWALVSLWISLASGIVVGIHYNPAEPFYSTSAIDILVPYGSFFRSVHFYSSQAFFFCTVLHYLATFDSANSYTARQFILLILCLPTALMLLFTGYVLRGDATGYSAGMIAEHIVDSIPLIGPALNSLLFSITDHGMTRVYLHHVISFDLLFLILAWDHLRRYPVRLSNHLLPIAALLVFSLIVAAPMDPDRLGVFYITGPWFFLGLQELLRYLPSFIAGVLVPTALVVGLVLLRKRFRWYRVMLVLVLIWLGCYGLLSLMALTAHG